MSQPSSSHTVEALFLRVLPQVLPKALIHELEQNSAQQLVDDAFDRGLVADSVLPLVSRSRISTCGHFEENNIITHLQSALLPELKHAATSTDPNLTLAEIKSGLRQLLDRRKTKAAIRQDCDRLVDEGIERELNFEHIQQCAHSIFNGRVYDELAANRRTALSLRGLRILTALAIGDQDPPPARIQLIHTACGDLSQGFPYVLKRVFQRKLIKLSFFADDRHSDLEQHRPVISRIFPPFADLLDAINGYNPNSSCYLEKHIDPEKPAHKDFESAFRQIPEFIEHNGVLVPKKSLLGSLRKKHYRIIEGTVCCTGLVGLLEILLVQIHSGLALPGGPQTRANEIVSRLIDAKRVSADLGKRLQIVFPEYDLGLRDLLSHGLFVFRDLEKLSSTLHGLTITADQLIREFSGLTYQKFFEYIQGRNLISPSSRQFIIHQAEMAPLEVKLGKDLSKLNDTITTVKHLLGDRSTQYKAAWMLWGEASKGGASFTAFYGLTLVLSVFESLVRTIYRLKGLPEVFITPEPHSRSVKCEYAILDYRPNNLLDPESLRKVFGDVAEDPSLHGAFLAGKQVRDAVMHGRWIELAGIELEALEFMLKLVYALLLSVKV